MIKRIFETKKLLTMALMVCLTLVFAAAPAGAAPLDFSSTTVDISVNDVVGSGLSFMGIFNDYILLGLGIVFAGIVAAFIFWLIARARRAAPGAK